MCPNGLGDVDCCFVSEILQLLPALYSTEHLARDQGRSEVQSFNGTVVVSAVLMTLKTL